MSKPSVAGRFPVRQAIIDVATVDDHVIVAAVPGKSIRVISIFFTCAGAATLTWLSGSTAITGAMDFEGLGGMALTTEDGIMWTNPGEALVLDLDDAVQVSGAITYIVI